ncbi:NUDIX domain-containing protein [soil metagenome]
MTDVLNRNSYPEKDILSSVSIDCIIFGLDEGRLKVLLVERAIEPSFGLWALPGGFVLEQEDLDVAARRTLEATTGMTNVFMEQVQAFGKVGRFPWRRVVTIAYYALIKSIHGNLRAGPDASDVRWFDVKQVPELVFDHRQILHAALSTLRTKVRREPIGFELLPQKFTLSELQGLYEAVLDTTFDTRNFRKKLLKMNLLVELDERQTGVPHRAARLYSFNRESYESLKEKGFIFEL